MTDHHTKRFPSLLILASAFALTLILCFSIQTVARAETGDTATPADVLPPVIGSLNINVKSPTEKESFTVRARSVMDDSSGIKEVKFRVYRKGEASATKKTYAGVSDGLGNWSMVFRLADFGGTPGEYIFTAYAYDKAGNSSFLTQSIVVEGHPDKTAPVIESLNINEKSPTSKTVFTVRAKNVTDGDSGVKEVVFRVWRAGAASATKKNFAGKSDGLGNWSMAFRLADFGNIAGDYSITVYARDNAGNVSTAQRSITIHPDTEAPTMGGIEFVGQPAVTANTEFEIRAKNMQDLSGIKEVKFTVWRSGAAAATKKVIQGEAKGGDYAIPFTIADYGGQTGVYNVTVSAEDKRGNFAVLGTGKIELVEPGHFAPPSMEGLRFSEKSPTTAKKFKMEAVGVYSEAGIKQVLFRVWREGAPDSSRTSAGQDMGNGLYSMDFDLDKFGGVAGVYRVYVYGEDVFGTKVIMAIDSIEVASAKQEYTLGDIRQGAELEIVRPAGEVVEIVEPVEEAEPPEQAPAEEPSEPAQDAGTVQTIKEPRQAADQSAQ